MQNYETVILDVKGSIYHGDFLLTTCVIGNDNNVWYHDGMRTGSGCENEGDFDSFSAKKLLKCKKEVSCGIVCESLNLKEMGGK